MSSAVTLHSERWTNEKRLGGVCLYPNASLHSRHIEEQQLAAYTQEQEKRKALLAQRLVCSLLFVFTPWIRQWEANIAGCHWKCLQREGKHFVGAVVDFSLLNSLHIVDPIEVSPSLLIRKQRYEFRNQNINSISQFFVGFAF